MRNNFFWRRNSILFILTIIMFALTNAIFAQTPISPTIWSGSPASAVGPSAFTTLPATVTPGSAMVNISQWDRAGVTFNAAAACYNSTSWQVGGTLALAQTNSKFVFFTVTNSAAVELQITRLFIRSQVSATGPQSVQVQCMIGAVTTDFGPLIATAHTATAEDWNLLDTICIGPGQTATFKVYGWGGTTAAGTLRINDGTAIIAGFTTPVTATASSTSPVCTGTSLSFSGSASGGIPGYTYSWAGPGGFSSTLLSPSISSVATTGAGVYTLTVTDVLSCTTSSTPVTTTVTVNTAPAAITGTLTLCQGLTTALSSASPGGTWSSSDISIATIGSLTGVVTGVTPSTATITYMLSTSCSTTAEVTVNPLPAAITGSMSICLSTTTTLSSITPSGTWTSSDITVATIGSSSGLLTAVATGTATITYTIGTGCYTTATITVYPFPAAITGTAVFCQGSTTTLSNTAAGGTWSSSNTAIATVGLSTGIVTGLAGGTAVITYTIGTSCIATRQITVNPLPANIGGSLQVCVSATQTLTNATPGGTWSSSTTGVATIGSLTGIMFGVSGGTATISYILISGCYITATATVNTLPAAITGLAGVCIGSSVNLNNTTPGGTWLSSNPTVATIGSTSGTLNGLLVGTSTISYVLTSTGCFVTRTETVNPLPNAITGPTTVCPGLTITLASTSFGGTWSSSNVTIATVVAGTGTVTGVLLTGGTVNITYTLPTGCITTRVTTVNPAPLAAITPLGDTTFCPGDFVVLQANTGAGLSYQWYQGATSLAGATTATQIASTTGSYHVRVTNVLGCPTQSAPMSILVNSVSATITVPGGVLTDCPSLPIVLNATTGAGLNYQWLLGGIAIPGATGASHTATLSGNYSVQVTNVTGCADISSPVTVTILPSPSASVSLSGSLSFCAGGNVVITGDAGVGYTYQWHNTVGAIAGATNISYTAATSGTYWVAISNTTGCTTNSANTIVVVNPLPPVGITLGGPKVFCSGGNVTLTASAGGYSYQWYKGGIAIAGANTNSYTASVSGGYRVRVTDLVTGCTDMTHADTVITLITSPVILPLTPTKFCWGGSSLLSTSVSTLGLAVLYQWYLNGVVIPGATLSTYSAGVSGNYSCSIVVPSSCTMSTSTATVTEMPLPDPVITQSGVNLRTSNYFVTYQWYKNLLPISGATSSTILHSGNGNYKVRVTDTNGCQSVSDTYVLTGSNGGGTTSVSLSHADETILIYPNPAQNTVYIESAIPLRAILSSIDGRKLIETPNAKAIELNALADGIYLLTLFDGNNLLVRVEKIVKATN